MIRLLLLFLVFGACAAENLVRNGNFAAGLTGWTIWPAKLHSQAEVALDVTQSVSAGQSCRITQRRPDLYSRIQQLNVPCKKNTRYVASFAARGLDIHSENRGGARMFIGPHGDLMRAITSFGPGIEQFKIKVPDYWTFGWKRYESEIFNSGDSDRLGVTLYLANASGTVWFDDIEIREYSPSIARSRSAEIIQTIIRRDLAVLNTLAPELKNEFAAFAAKLSAVQRVPANRYAGMPLHPAQRELGMLFSRALGKRFGTRNPVIASVADDPLAPQSAFVLPDATRKHGIELSGLRGENECFALNFTNTTDRDQAVRIRPPMNIPMRLRLATHVETDRRTVVDDALKLLRPNPRGEYSLIVPPGMTRQLYVQCKLEKDAVGVLEAENEKFPITLRTSKYALPAQLPLRLFSYDMPFRFPLLGKRAEATRAALRFMHDDTAHFYQFHSPQPVFDAEGTLRPEKMDWSRTEQHLAMMKQPAHAMVYPPVHSDPHLTEYLGKSNGRAIAPLSQEWERRLTVTLRALVKGFAERGIGYDRLLITLRDEPAERDLDYLEKVANVVRKADSKLRIYNNFHYAISENGLRRLCKICDIVAPELESMTPRNLAIIRESGRELYCYHVQNRNVAGNAIRDNFRRFRRENITGFSYWCFFEGHNEWEPSGAQSYSVVYRGDADEWTPSKRSEGIREGMEDFTLLTLLARRAPQTYARLMRESNSKSRRELRRLALDALK